MPLPKVLPGACLIILAAALAAGGCGQDTKPEKANPSSQKQKNTKPRLGPQYVGFWQTIGTVSSSMYLSADGRATYDDGWNHEQLKGTWHSDNSSVTLEFTKGSIRLDYESFNGNLEDHRSGNIFSKR